MEAAHTLNLARKWRSSHFDQIVGQDLSVRMLKNSLYSGHIFPVYLFAGQRGCGKTSTARIFAAALNCQHLSLFRKQPKETIIPCLECSSCLAMQQSSHPDFIEIDAASHTGVDNVRSIIEASTFMPLIGEKKIYLIDEAHMLSKAAFNAFLKILEEPPISVVFILATTDSEKIIETVRSRCFQLFFKPIKNDELIVHLQTICLAENIHHDRPGLELIVKESQGSARDAINLLEQVRFASTAVTFLSVSQVLGHVDDRVLLNLLQAIFSGTARDVAKQLSELSYEGFSLDFIWHRLIELVRTMVWHKYGLSKSLVTAYDGELDVLAHHCSFQLLQSFLMMMHKEYATFVRTTAQQTFFEMLCLRSAKKENSDDSDGGSHNAGFMQSQPSREKVFQESEENIEQEDDDEEEGHSQFPVDSWSQFVLEVTPEITNPLLLSVLQGGTVIELSDQTYQIFVDFPKRMQLFSDVLETNRSVIEFFIQRKYGKKLHFKPSFQELRNETIRDFVSQNNSENSYKDLLRNDVSHVHVLQKNEKAGVAPRAVVLPSGNKGEASLSRSGAVSYYTQKGVVSNGSWERNAKIVYDEPLVDVSDKNKWKKAAMLLEYFPGTITEIYENTNEQQAQNS